MRTGVQELQEQRSNAGVPDFHKQTAARGKVVDDRVVCLGNKCGDVLPLLQRLL
jgi:hypothetical protein